MSIDLNLPWRTPKWANTAYVNIIGADGELVINALPLPLANHIVRCVNAHEGLVEALQAILEANEATPVKTYQKMESIAKAALAAATGEQK